jgi:hypothetical protein
LGQHPWRSTETLLLAGTSAAPSRLRRPLTFNLRFLGSETAHQRNVVIDSSASHGSGVDFFHLGWRCPSLIVRRYHAARTPSMAWTDAVLLAIDAIDRERERD